MDFEFIHYWTTDVPKFKQASAGMFDGGDGSPEPGMLFLLRDGSLAVFTLDGFTLNNLDTAIVGKNLARDSSVIKGKPARKRK